MSHDHRGRTPLFQSNRKNIGQIKWREDMAPAVSQDQLEVKKNNQAS